VCNAILAGRSSDSVVARASPFGEPADTAARRAS
jgi:hypothetical protein